MVAQMKTAAKPIPFVREFPILGCKSQDSAGDFYTILRVIRYTLKRRDRRLAIGEDTCHGESIRTTDLALRCCVLRWKREPPSHRLLVPISFPRVPYNQDRVLLPFLL